MIEASDGIRSPVEGISDKQFTLLAFPYSDYDAVISEGAVRSGKTIFSVMSLVDWAMQNFNGMNFAICGYSVKSVERNIIIPYRQLAYAQENYKITVNHSDSVMKVRAGNVENNFYIFGGGNEGSYEKVQGLTLAGCMIDEVVLLAESFVNQVMTRLSVDGAKVWFTCNPGSTGHWFFKKWVCRDTAVSEDSDEYYKVLRLHFTLDDNPGLGKDTRRQLKSRWPKESVHYRWYILGEWVSPEGLVYDCFSQKKHVVKKLPGAKGTPLWWISVDYGITNPFAALLWRVSDGRAYVADEVYLGGKANGQRYTDEELYDAMAGMAGDRVIQAVVVDPSASSFIETVRRRGRYDIRKANNEVLAGISSVYSLLKNERIKVVDSAVSTIEEFALYSWDPKSTGKEMVKKENDHAMDAIRYMAHTILRREFAGLDD